MPRLFVGLELPESVAETLSGLAGGIEGARFVAREDLHVTLRFVGDVDGDVADDLYAALAERRPREPIALAIDGLASFGGDKPHALIATLPADPALVDLQGEVERLARRAGLPPETRKFVPHVTLARMRRADARAVAAWIAAREPLPPLHFSADRITVFSAKPGSGGGPYVVEAAYPLAE